MPRYKSELDVRLLEILGQGAQTCPALHRVLHEPRITIHNHLTRLIRMKKVRKFNEVRILKGHPKVFFALVL